jgi:cephalosporin-C deacetylase-like acetyl esterase
LTVSTAETADQLAMTYNVADEDFIFLGNDVMTFTANVANTNPWNVKGNLVVKMTTDKNEPVSEATRPIFIQAKALTGESFKMKAPAPGFYHFTVQFVRHDNTLMEESFNLGYEPEKINSPVDAHDDFKAFWDNNLKELGKVPPNYQMTLVPEASNKDYDMYLVQMQSLDNKSIHGYYAKPKHEGKFPVMVEYMGYGSNPYYASTRWDGFAHYVPSIRGQGLNRLTKEDDFWLTIGLKDKQGYYYKGGFCDVVRAIDFVCSRPEVDTEKVVARGGSQGGALSFVAAALDKRVKVCAPSIPFLSDYRDYFAIAPWPKSDFDNYAKSHPEFTWEHTYDLLTYFDIKNFAPWITCPLIMSFGVQDPICPPHINFAAYNQVKSEKVWVACPRSEHSTNAHAGELEHKFILSHLGLAIE